MQIKKTSDLTSKIYQDALAIRKEVFVLEQQIPLALEIKDETQNTYYVAYKNELALGCARVAKKDDTIWHIGRVAVLKKMRKKGVASEILLQIETDAKSKNIQKLVLNAQKSALGLYQKLGYTICGNPFLEADILHYKLEKTCQALKNNI